MAITNHPAAPAGRRLRDQRGAVLVEFALCATVFLALIYGTVSYGVVFWVKSTMTSAAEEGARAAIGGGSAVDRANQVFDSTLKSHKNGATVAVDPAKNCTTNGVTATCTQVTATYNYKDFPIVPKIPLFTFLPDQVQSIAMIQTS